MTRSRKLRPTLWMALAALLLTGPALRAEDQHGSHDNVDKNHLAVQGYDVVAYFTENKAVMGDASITAVHHGAAYRFASEANRKAFEAEPARYAPAYGGWCATAVALKSSKVQIDPRSFKIVGQRLMLFYKGLRGDALKEWNKHDEAELVRKADENWKKITGE